MIESAQEKSVSHVTTRANFKVPEMVARVRLGPVMQRIQYDRPQRKVHEVMAKLGASSYKRAGELTFDYYYEAEIKQ